MCVNIMASRHTGNMEVKLPTFWTSSPCGDVKVSLPFRVHWIEILVGPIESVKVLEEKDNLAPAFNCT